MNDELTSRLEAAGQQHVLAFWDELNDRRRTRLAEQLADVDFELVDRLFRGHQGEHDWESLAAGAEPPAAFRLDGSANEFSVEEARDRGEQALREGKVAAVLVAGGQGSRLGFHHPKGMFPLGPVSRRTLFEMHVDQLLAVGGRYGPGVPLYLMTSPATHQETLAYFFEHGRLGLVEDYLRIFSQGTMPAVDADSGRLLLAKKSSLALSPDGHGGTLAALVRSGSLEEMRQRGIEQLFYFQVDNPLGRICDPVFIGYHLLAESEMSTQVVAKTSPLDRVGNFVNIDGHAAIIEYSDLPRAVAERRSEDGSLYLWAGNIAVHVFDVDFLQRMSGSEENLPYHRARKKVSYIDGSGERVHAEQENAIKFERFIFDLLPHSERAIVVEVDEAETFAPVKNASGHKKDTPETSQAALVALHAKWLQAADVVVEAGIPVEINPRFALDEEEFKGKVKPGLRVVEPTYFI